MTAGRGWKTLGVMMADLAALLRELAVERRVDRLAVALVSDDGQVTLVAAASARPHRSEALEDVSRTVIQAAAREGGFVSSDGLDDAGASVSELAILRAVAVPLPTGVASPSAILYADVRRAHALGELEPEPLAAIVERVAVFLGSSLQDELAWTLLLPGLAPLAPTLRAWSESSIPLLVLGEPGVGKTHLALALSRALSGPVVRATLGASDDLNTVVSELFGHERGAFSGAVQKRAGLVEHAAGGTLVLDEILSLPRPAQTLLLDFVQFGSFRPLGFPGREPKRVRTRLIGVTNGDLARAVEEGRFRQDLADRWMGFTVEIPPLRMRRADIPALAVQILSRIDPEARLSVELRSALLRGDLHWPGNVRQLDLAVRRAHARVTFGEARTPRVVTSADFFDASFVRAESRSPTLDPAATLTPLARATSSPGGDRRALGGRWAAIVEARRALERDERGLIEEALALHGGVVTRAARELGAKRTSLLSRMAKLDVKVSR
jgi:DNA-binding NtrC family response regulator